MMTEQVEFCHVHGRPHDGELETVDTIPHEFIVGVNDWDDPVVEPCHTEEWTVVALEPEEFKVTDETVLTQNLSRGFFTLKSGDLAYIYTVRGGVVPCKVVSVSDEETHVLVTADRTGWRRGDVETIRNPKVSLIHRDMAHTYRGQVRVTGSLRMVTDRGRLL